MPISKSFAGGTLLRPLLRNSRSELLAYAQRFNLGWIEDPSNEHITLDRNYLRHEVMPIVKLRWPSADRSMARTAVHLAEANTILQEVAEQDWQTVNDGTEALFPDQLRISALKTLSLSRQRNLIRHWIHRINHAPLPDTKRLQQIFDEVIAAAEDCEPCVQWQGLAVRRYRQRLYLTASELVSGNGCDWDLRQALPLSGLNVRLVVEASVENGLEPSLIGQGDMRIAFRQGGEVCCPAGRGGQHHELRKLFQEWGVPPWKRPRVPLLYVGNKIAAVIGFCVCEGFSPRRQDNGIGIKIEDLSGHGIARHSENNDNNQD